MNLRYPFRLLLSSLLPALALSGCGEADTPVPGQTEREPMAYMSLSIATTEMPDQSRADYTFDDPDNNYFEDPTTAYEKIHTMRFIIVDSAGCVEHNVSVSEDNVVKTKPRLFKVKPNEEKKIYLIGNEASIPDDVMSVYSSLQNGEEFPVDDANTAILKSEAGQPLFTTGQYIPMTEVFDFQIGDPQYDADGIRPVPYTATLFVTRASIKATFNLEVGTDYYNFNPGMLSTITLNEIADMEYLFPYNTWYEPSKVPPSGDPRVITAFDAPKDATTAPFTVDWIKTDNPDQRKFTTGTVYLPETKYGNLADRKYYSITLPVNGAELIADLPNLPDLQSLARNTHLLVNIKLNGRSMTCTVTVLPYTGVDLNPDYGIDRP